MCCLSLSHCLDAAVCGPLQFVHFFYFILAIIEGTISPHRRHLYSLVQLVFVCPSLLQFVHCICVLFMYSRVLILYCLWSIVLYLVNSLVLVLLLFCIAVVRLAGGLYIFGVTREYQFSCQLRQLCCLVRLVFRSVAVRHCLVRMVVC